MIELVDATIGYPRKPVLGGVSLTIDEGDYAVIHGENGCGKSPLLKTILGIIKPLEGTVACSANPSEIGYLTQLNPLRFDFPATCAEIISTGLRCKGSPFSKRREVQEAVWLSLERMGIEDLENADYRQLSGGQRQRVLIARALAAARTLLVLDEPTNEIDVQTTQALFTLLDQLNQFGMTILMVSHDAQAQAHASKLVHLGGDGVRVEEGRPR